MRSKLARLSKSDPATATPIRGFFLFLLAETGEIVIQCLLGPESIRRGMSHSAVKKQM